MNDKSKTIHKVESIIIIHIPKPKPNTNCLLLSVSISVLIVGDGAPISSPTLPIAPSVVLIDGCIATYIDLFKNGFVVGSMVGVNIVGYDDGCIVGSIVGYDDGFNDGSIVGSNDGLIDGKVVGDSDGVFVTYSRLGLHVSHLTPSSFSLQILTIEYSRGSS